VKALVIGASSEVGSRTATALVARGVAVRAMVRRADAVDPLRASGVDDVVIANLADPTALTRAFDDVQRVFVMSSPTREQVSLEGNAIDAAEAAGVAHVAKLSNIPVPGLDSGLHGNHRAIERRALDSPMDVTILQPSFFSSVLLRQLPLLRRGRLVLPTGAGRIAWIDPRDIADVATEVLLSGKPLGALRLTGPEAVDGDELADRLGVRRLDPPRAEWRTSLLDSGMDPWLVDSTVHLYDAVERGALDFVSPDVERVVGCPPRPIDEWIDEELRPRLEQD
jgi:uncharacterized protein YbjT (DUF2867 family)